MDLLALMVATFLAAAVPSPPAALSLAQGEAVMVPCQASKAASGDPTVATATRAEGGVKIAGVAEGRTSVLIWDASKRLRSIAVTVGRPPPPVPPKTAAPETTAVRTVQLRVGEKTVLKLPRVARMPVSDQGTVDVRFLEQGVELSGLREGATTVILFHVDGSRSDLSVKVSPSEAPRDPGAAPQ